RKLRARSKATFSSRTSRKIALQRYRLTAGTQVNSAAVAACKQRWGIPARPKTQEQKNFRLSNFGKLILAQHPAARGFVPGFAYFSRSRPGDADPQRSSAH